VLYVNESLDITAQVLSALQARAKSGAKAPTPAKPAPKP
jgi:outer membrane protein